MPPQDKHALLESFAALLGPDANIDRHGQQRIVPMEVLSLGICRTGTLSMKEAFRILGYPSPYHFLSILTNVLDADIWNELLRKSIQKQKISQQELDQVIGHCGAVTDTPCAVLWRDLVAAYPEAMVILVEREEGAWYHSIETLLEGMLNPIVSVLCFTDPSWFGRIFKLGPLWTQAWLGTSNLEQAKKNARAVYRAHNAAVRATVPKERLLEYELGSGWEPLCKLLRKPVPNVPFPRLNESKALKAAFETAFGRAIRRSLVNISIAVALAAVFVGAAAKLLR